MLKSNLLVLVAYLLVFSSCSTPPENVSTTNEKPRPVVLIFNKNPDSESIDVSGLKYSMYSPLKYFDEKNYLEVFQYPRYTSTNDTITMTVGEEIFIYHKYKFQPYNIYAKEGDTIEISSTNDVLTFRTRNREVSYYENNFDSYFYSKIADSVKMDFFFYREVYSKRKNIRNYNLLFTKDINNVLSLFDYKKFIIDSLVKANAMSSYMAKMHLANLEHERNLFRRQCASDKKGCDSLPRIEYNDSSLVFGAYRFSLYKQIEQDVKVFVMSNGVYIDAREAFNRVYGNAAITPETKKFLLTHYIKKIFEAFPSDFPQFVAEYKKVVADTVLLGNIARAEAYLAKSNETDSTLNLQSSRNEKKTLDEVVNGHKGSVIYVDFWASWCAPCRESMPYAKELRGEYNSSKIAFVYLALNDKEKTWKNAIATLGLDSGCENYLITNPVTSEFIKSHNVESIPRYMIFDKKGKLVHSNAPGPEGKEIRALLNKYLSE